MKETYQQFNRRVYDYYNQYYATEALTLKRRQARNIINNDISIKQNNCNYFIKNSINKKFYFYNPPDYQYAFIEYNPINKNSKMKKIQQFVLINGCWANQGCFFIGAKRNLQTYLLGCPNKGINFGKIVFNENISWYAKPAAESEIYRFKQNRITSSGPCNQN
jgi:hypothetical protein